VTQPSRETNSGNASNNHNSPRVLVVGPHRNTRINSNNESASNRHVAGIDLDYENNLKNVENIF
jgi:hypothetical protein